MAYSVEICNQIVRFLDEDDWKYQLDTQKELIRMGMTLSSKMKHADIIIDLREDKFFVYYTCPLNVDEGERAEMRDLLNRINYDLMFGNFEMDERDGEIRFRYAVDCNNSLPSQEVIKGSLYRPLFTLKKYGDAIVQVLMGMSNGKDAFERAQKA